MEDEYWTVTSTFYRYSPNDTWKIDIATYDPKEGKKDICRWIGESPITEDQLENMTIIWQTLMTARLNVQLGLDLGLIS